jgi:hypothetical protein
VPHRALLEPPLCARSGRSTRQTFTGCGETTEPLAVIVENRLDSGPATAYGTRGGRRRNRSTDHRR